MVDEPYDDGHLTPEQGDTSELMFRSPRRRPMRALLLGLLLLAPVALAHGPTEPQDDCGSGADATSNVFSGPVLSTPADCVAHLGRDDERDSFRVEAPPGTRLRVEIVPLLVDAFPNIGLYSPDHNGDGQSTWRDRNDVNRTWLAYNSTEPGLWGFYVFLQNKTTGRLLHGDYRVVLTLEGEAWTPDAYEGDVLLGSPAGPRVGRVAGPDAPTDGLDGDWLELATPTTGADFVRATTDACDECLRVDYKLASGSTFDASCQTGGGATSCMPFAGVTHVMVSSVEGTHVPFVARHWHAP